jgi:hypothetical protein
LLADKDFDSCDHDGLLGRAMPMTRHHATV